ncbi:helix-turn-helix domain-containing protein [Streptomyces roseolilacinus]|uniref:HTH cro/C1-type domain-containing protein n=1 Tax=Streptomyces roseolilacinus TaxID=66904 RepID=A0A918EKR8_9ACTN|nr:helix-turn-helix domain-containing protein [Streptomyces roseolilacinus]GGQ07782.1 hypothetical protein GCM10010249_27700 [Streptomyces roseolilacinus]
MAEGERPRQGTPAQRLGGALRALQQRSGRTLRSLEQEVLISDSSLSRYFRGSTVPPWSTVRDLCRALGADPTEYRALWEAADRSQVRPEGAADPVPGPTGTVTAPPTGTAAVPPAGTAAVPPAGPAARAGAPGPSTAGPGGGARWWTAAVRARPARGWVCAAAGAVSGVVLGALLMSLAAPRAPAPPAGVPAVRAADGGGGEPGGTAAPRVRRVFVSRQTGRCLDDSLDERLRTYKCNGMSYQWWTAHALTDGSHRLANHATGRCLEDTAAGPRAVRCGPDGARAREWVLTVWGDESVEVRSRATGKCLDDSGTGLRTLPCDRTDRQKWG